MFDRVFNTSMLSGDGLIFPFLSLCGALRLLLVLNSKSEECLTFSFVGKLPDVLLIYLSPTFCVSGAGVGSKSLLGLLLLLKTKCIA